MSAEQPAVYYGYLFDVTAELFEIDAGSGVLAPRRGADVLQRWQAVKGDFMEYLGYSEQAFDSLAREVGRDVVSMYDELSGLTPAGLTHSEH